MKALFISPPSQCDSNVVRDLVYGCWCKGRRIAGVNFPPLPLALGSAVIKAAGHQARVLDLQVEKRSFQKVAAQAKSSDLAVVLTSSVSLAGDDAYLTRLKEANPQLLTLVYGGYPTCDPDAVLEYPGVDIALRGELEFFLHDLALAIEEGDWHTLKGISYRGEGQNHHNPDYPRRDDLDSLPIADRDALPGWRHYFNPVAKNYPYATMMTSRGCPGKCIFCASPAFYGHTYRSQSSARVLEEMEYLAKRGYREIFFRDENFTFQRSRVMEICQSLKEWKVNLSWVASARVDQLDRELLQVMQAAGCHLIRVGVESGSQELLDRVKKGTTLEQIRRVFAWCRELKLDTHAHMMAGLPGETRDTLEATRNLIREIEPAIITLGILTPYPGTPLFEALTTQYPDLQKTCRINLNHLHTQAFYPLTQVSSQELSDFIRKVYREFYFRREYLWGQLTRKENWRKLGGLIQAAFSLREFTRGRD